MKKKISVLLALVLALSLVLFGCGGDTGEGTTSGTDTVAGTNDIADGNNAASDEGNTEPKEGYLDEATGIYHTALFNADNIPVSFSVPDGWRVIDGLYRGANQCSLWPPEGVDTDDDVPGFIIWYNLSDEGAQAVYDGMNENGSLGDSQEVTYGSNTYISNVTPNANERTYFFHTGKSSPMIYVETELGDGNQAALEEVLSTLTY